MGVITILSVATLAAKLAFSSPLETRHANCKAVSFKVSGSAYNRDFSQLSLADPTTIIEAGEADILPKILTNGTETIGGYYCEPTVKNANNGKLQVFVGSIGTTRDMWSGLGGTNLGVPAYQPEKYSWIDYANKQGYPTLATDLPGDGTSSRSEPILINQGPYTYDLIHDLAVQLRAGTTSQLPHPFTTLIFVGNSYGSVIGNNIAALYPSDFDAFVLTGFSKRIDLSLPGALLTAPVPGALFNPAKYATYDPAYVVTPIEATRTGSFFGAPDQVDFDPVMAKKWYTTQDVIALGQLFSIYVQGITAAPGYKGRVLVLTGEQDQIFCGFGNPALGVAACGSLLEETKELFPAAEYSYQSVPRSGHTLILHDSAQKTLDYAHRFLAGARFGVYGVDMVV
ncbi:alpha/beta-hydrolase [Pseudovirgaria hyperparasitica]|uniref:Alpha/beta-hydrolase n=1 Tax=Pseudovirgaria hyperparasitica TaxID=470096 RepID=A0A6A6WM06_9PEZI|nr:alpha/beta-hydrolase [Pseudovirgaria hyperparasitica]KAF2763231.1 alpha/beta-hydrolase [Pseudovirgaria hyperparasitica]